jgi:hypothetical protein
MTYILARLLHLFLCCLACRLLPGVWLSRRTILGRLLYVSRIRTFGFSLSLETGSAPLSFALETLHPAVSSALRPMSD